MTTFTSSSLFSSVSHSSGVSFSSLDSISEASTKRLSSRFFFVAGSSFWSAGFSHANWCQILLQKDTKAYILSFFRIALQNPVPQYQPEGQLTHRMNFLEQPALYDNNRGDYQIPKSKFRCMLHR
jgi:hypothetical protein